MRDLVFVTDFDQVLPCNRLANARVDRLWKVVQHSVRWTAASPRILTRRPGVL